ncbi:class I adenylate-forming enzyme family protein [Erwinia sp. Leaf53]|uniref:class I adenylate-forming enzyme family protein n=1 Tax=Erwinia sp. Leaf53 TaxID=1736225 RepID=UPI0006F5165A|nr:class I adenylate-forming enzyme family protein [Erwinia sp. Leaf53]KQN58160.1 AMP-dependent synthetase [Erwinia sp. Leaf53]
MPVHDRVQQHAQTRPDAIAVDIDGQRLSWRQLSLRSLALYQYIHSQPAASGIVAIATGNDIGFPVCWLAATAQPGVAAILDPQLPQAQLQDILTRLAPDLLLLKSHDRPLIALADRLAIRWLAVDDWQPSSAPASDDVPPIAATPRLFKAFTAGMQDATPFLINFTSGTTSLPKAFSRSRRSWRSSFENGEAIFGLDAAPSTLFPGPLAHGIGLYCLNETLYAGGTFYSMGRWQPAAALDLMAQLNIARLVVVPTMINGLARAASGASNVSLPTLKQLLSAGAKLELNHYRQARALFPLATMQEYYGASELGFIAFNTLDDDNISASLATVGLAFPGTTLSIRDDNGGLLPPGQPGTIWLQSEQIINGYLWGDDGQAFVRRPWGATVADIGWLDAQQRLHVIGRRGNMILSGGNNIYLAEIESLIKSLPGVIEAVVIAVADGDAGQKAVAIVEGSETCLQTLPQQCRQRLAKYKLPRHYFRTESWPLTASGKIKRADLAERIAHRDRHPELTEIPARG